MHVRSIIKASIPALLACVAMSVWSAPMQNGYGRLHRGGQFQQRLQQGSADRGRATTLPAGAREVRNVAYGSAPDQALDVYIPHDTHAAPIVFMVHGGGWQRGDKANDGVVQNKIDYFLPRGFILVSVDYRMLPAVGVMTEGADVATALAYVQAHAASWGGDASSIVVMGHSAGAHLVMLLTSTPAIRQAAGVAPWRATIALDSAGYDITALMRGPHLRLYDQVFGSDPALWEAASPTLALQAAPPVPVLLVCSTLRRNSCDQAAAYAARATGFGGRVELDRVALQHRQINVDVGLPGALTDTIADFIQAQGIH